MIRAALFAMLTTAACLGAQAQQQATPVNGDTRLVTFNYDPDQSYLILVRPRSMTHIQLRQDEKVITLGAGDTSNFTITVSANKSNVLIRPKYSDMTTSLTLITSERSYPIMLRSTDETTGKWYQRVSWNIDEQIVLDTQPVVAPVNLPRSQPKAPEESTAQSNPGGLSLDRMNFGYTVEGRAPFAPTHVFDDGSRTFIRLPEQIEVLPALFGLGEGSDGQVLNYTMDKSYMVVQGTHAAMLLKLGKAEVRVTRAKKASSGLSRLFGGDGG